MYKIGMSSAGSGLPCESYFERLAEANINATELCLYYEDCKVLDYKEIARYSKRTGVEIWSYHLPFYILNKEFSIVSIDKNVREHTIKCLCRIIAKASECGVDKFVIHPSDEPVSDEEREEKIKHSMESLNFLADFAKQFDAYIAVEDLPRSCIGNTSEEIKRLISVNDRLRVCFDTNHLLKESPVNFIEKLGDKIITLHVSDYDFIDEKHWLPGEGRIDWKELYSKLREIGYNGVWMYEIGPKAPPHIIRDRDLIPQDFYENAMAIFNNQTPRPVGHF